MGIASSVFDCAINPLNPLPGDDTLAPSHQPAIEIATPLRESLIWQAQRAFYAEKGLTAWSQSIVPNFASSNSFIAKAYARAALGLIRDASVVGEGGLTSPVVIIELGSGHAKLAYLVCEMLLRDRAFFPANNLPEGALPFRYVITGV
jgi:hypothetical protein